VVVDVVVVDVVVVDEEVVDEEVVDEEVVLVAMVLVEGVMLGASVVAAVGVGNGNAVELVAADEGSPVPEHAVTTTSTAIGTTWRGAGPEIGRMSPA